MIEEKLVVALGEKLYEVRRLWVWRPRSSAAGA
jgi:hypothetical protein